MNHRPPNDYLRVNKSGKYIRKSIFHQPNANAILQPPQPQHKPQVYIINKKDFKSIVQQLTSYQSCEYLPQNIPRPYKTSQEPINRTPPVPPNATAVHQEDPNVSLYMRCLQNLLEDDSSESNGNDQFQQPCDEYQSHMLVQPQVPIPYGVNQDMTNSTMSSSWFDGSHQQMHGHGGYSMQSTEDEYSQPWTPNLTFSSMEQSGLFDPDLDNF
ncbi:unnamed protein product [Cochlearia groenlandica]